MAELMTIEQRSVSAERVLAEENRQLRAERQAMMRAMSAMPGVDAPPARNNVPWIVVGCLAALAMLMSFAWSSGQAILASMEKLVDQHHELALAAAQPAQAASGQVDETNMAVVGAMIALAAILIILGVMRR